MARNKKFFYALTTLTSAIIGAGIFSLPYITARAGLGTMLFYFLLVGAVLVIVSFVYGEVVLRTKELCRLPGYAEKYLGPQAKKIVFLTNSLGLVGALLAYLVVGAKFLSSLLSPIWGNNELLCAFILFLPAALLIYFDVKIISQVVLLSFIVFFIALGLIFYQGLSLIRLDNLLVFSAKDFFLPYGAVLFSLLGVSLVPETKEILKDNPRSLKKIIFWSTFISALAYLVFIILVTGITGQNTSTEAIAGLRGILPSGVIGLILFLGFANIFDSFLTIGLTLKKNLWYDWKINKNLSWLLACFMPLVLFLAGLKNLIVIVSLTGGIMGGIDLIFIVLIYLKAKKQGELKPAYQLNLPDWLSYGLILFFLLGIIYEVYYFIR